MATDAIRKNPHLYEINLMTWLDSLSEKEGRHVTLDTIPREEWVRLKNRGIDIVWLMGMWKRSTHSKMMAREAPNLVEECDRILDDFSVDDITGSPYAVAEYVPHPAWGDVNSLRLLGRRLEKEGLFLVLDFVPNHTACDHPWITQHPERYIRSGASRNGTCEKGFFSVGRGETKRCVAHGKDPFFPHWTDTAQIDYSNPETTGAMTELAAHVQGLCHGLRCDMAMLVISDVFKKTWKGHMRHERVDEFWPQAIERARSAGGRRLWIAEAYWGMEQCLLNMGFDYVYDKTFADLVAKGDGEGLKNHLAVEVALQERMVRFLENHDEPRAMEVFGPDRIRCAMVAHATLPGMRFWQHGQFRGCRVRVPVQLRRAPREEAIEELASFSERLLREVNHPVFHQGVWRLCEISGWPDNQSHKNLLAWCWEMGREGRLVVVNLSSSPSQGYVKIPEHVIPDGERILFLDCIQGDSFLRPGADTADSGLYVALDGGKYHFFSIEKG